MYRRLIIFIVTITVLSTAWPKSQNVARDVPVSAADSVSGLHVIGSEIHNGAGQMVRLRGVNRTSGEYACIFNFGILVGETDAASIQAMLDWRINVVRLPLNEDCWLDVNMDDLNPAYRGANYRAAIIDYVTRLTQAGIAVILDPPFTLTANAPSCVFGVGREQPGLPITLPLLITDACGPWTTFVGAGAAAP